MISLTCTSCKKVLQIDDAFAGGVCRCQFCGTIQTVPSTLKRSGRPGAPPSTGAKTLYQKTKPGKPGTGLEELAEAVSTSSGLSRNALKTRAAAPPVEPKRSIPVPVLYAAGGVAAVVLAFVLWIALRGPANPTNGGNGATTEPSASLPTFAGLPLDVTSVVYLIDRGDSTRYCFPELKEVTLRSIASLGPDRRFAVIFWNNGTDNAFPTAGMVKANDNQVAAARRALEDIYPFGQTDMRGPLQQAVDLKPGAILIATGKGWDLDSAFVNMVDEIAGGTGVKIHCFTVGAGGSSRPLETLATRYGGQYREVTEDQLRERSR